VLQMLKLTSLHAVSLSDYDASLPRGLHKGLHSSVRPVSLNPIFSKQERLQT